MFKFLKNVGDKLTGAKLNAEEIEKKIKKELGDQIIELNVTIEGGEKVVLSGLCVSKAAREKAILIAGNIRGVFAVIYYKLKIKLSGAEAAAAVAQQAVSAPASAPAEAAKAPMAEAEEVIPEDEPEPDFYTIVAGDTLSKIAKQFYGDANKYPLLFEANREVIKDPNKIYVGQTIRVPKDI